ncbi:MAG: Xaa-Pro peptidase family protein [Thermoleophilia bacterium]|nr:Xaa-Pro peptidase family protein [Thermoleophilia bacterium]
MGARPTRAANKPCRHDSLLVTHLPNVRYLTGFSGSAGCVLLTPRRKYFFTDFRYEAQAAKEVRGFDIRIVRRGSLDGCCRYVISRKIKTGVIGFDGAHISLRDHQLIKKLLKGFTICDAAGEIEKRRLVKSRSELVKLRQAAKISDAAYTKLARSKVVGKTEKEIAWMLESSMRQSGSGPMPFEIIVASGPRSAMPHGAATSRVIRSGELVVVDMGASVDGYCSDATRTFATGPLPGKLVEIYQIVYAAQKLAMDCMAEGTVCLDADRFAREHIAVAGYGAHFGHSLGHGVGLEPHEGPVLSSLSKDTLSAGMTVTVEPGIYLDRLGGVRIEDTVLVGTRGVQPLTKFPRELITLR